MAENTKLEVDATGLAAGDGQNEMKHKYLYVSWVCFVHLQNLCVQKRKVSYIYARSKLGKVPII